ncbi:MAG: hypothetical protein H6622_02820 [Halobacteriovoraceae bacterium]|nr:hypothetical protein [Halobacteriovoraceae bacterium]
MNIYSFHKSKTIWVDFSNVGGNVHYCVMLNDIGKTIQLIKGLFHEIL